MKTSNQSVKAILVDLDGVLRLWPDEAYSIENSHGLPRGAIEKIAFAAPRLLPAINGSLSDADWRESITRELLRVYPHSDASTAVRLWSESPGKLDSQAIQAISTYDVGVNLVLATNATSRLKNDLNALGILDLFSNIANSSELGVVKPEPAFYRAALELAESHAEQTIYIDDTVENVQAALELGMRSHHFIDVEGLEAFLSQCILGQVPGAHL